MGTKKILSVLALILTLSPAIRSYTCSIGEAYQVLNGSNITGYVVDVTASADVIYAGGLIFNAADRMTGSGAVGDITTGNLLAGSPVITGGDVVSSIPDGAGGWYISGTFTHINGQPKPRYARIKSDLTVDTDFNASPERYAFSMFLSGAVLYACTYEHIYEINAVTGSHTIIISANDVIKSVIRSGDMLYLGGHFGSVSGTAASRLAVYDLSTGEPLAGFSFTTDGDIETMQLAGGSLYIAGNFSTVNTVPAPGLAKINALTGGLDANFVPSIQGQGTQNPSVYRLEVSGGAVYFAGSFENVGGLSRPCLAAVSASDGSVVSAFNPQAELEAGQAFVSVFGFSGSTVYAGIGPDYNDWVYYIGSFNAADGTKNGDFRSAPNLNPWTFSVSGAAVFTGGLFTGYEAVTRTAVAAINRADGKVLASFAPAFRGLWNSEDLEYDYPYVPRIAVYGSRVYVSGNFSEINGISITNFAALDALTGAPDTGFAAVMNGMVISMSGHNGKLYIGGPFTTVNGVARPGFAAIDAATGVLDNDFAPVLTQTGDDPGVSCMLLHNGILYAAGGFETASGEARQNIAAWNISDASLVAGFNPGVDGGVVSMATDGVNLFLGGNFTSAGGGARQNIASVTMSGGSLNSFNPGANNQVNSIDIAGDRLFAAGMFTNFAGTARNSAAAVNKETGAVVAGFNPQLSIPNSYMGNEYWMPPFIYSMKVLDDVLFGVGTFLEVDNKPASGIAAFCLLENPTATPTQVSTALPTPAITPTPTVTPTPVSYLLSENDFLLNKNMVNTNSGETVKIYHGIRDMSAVVEARIYNLRGVLVRKIEFSAANEYGEWDCKNETGRDAGAGIYIIQASAGSARKTLKVSIIK